jgi:hypothetical protein
MKRCFILKGSSRQVYDELHYTDGEFLAWYGNINTNHPQSRQSSDLIMYLTRVWRIMLKILAGIARTSRPVIRPANVDYPLSAEYNVGNMKHDSLKFKPDMASTFMLIRAVTELSARMTSPS